MLALAGTAPVTVAAAQDAAEPPKSVIFETDMTFDVDDVGALAVLHALADRGEADIAAVCYNEVHAHGVAAISAVNAWYGRPDIPIGRYAGDLERPDASRYLGHLARFPHHAEGRDAPSALDVYRRVLGTRPDRSATIISVGFLNNLDDLLRADAELVRRKVRELVVMGGRHNDAFNLVRHGLVEATQRVLADWPTPLVISDFGYGVRTGTALAGSPSENPVREAYFRWFDESFKGRPSWDQVAVLYGVRGLDAGFALETTGTASLVNGYELSLAPDWRSYLVAREPVAAFAALIEDLMVAAPRHGQP